MAEQNDIPLPVMKHHAIRTYNEKFVSRKPPRNLGEAVQLLDGGLLENRHVALETACASIGPTQCPHPTYEDSRGQLAPADLLALTEFA